MRIPRIESSQWMRPRSTSLLPSLRSMRLHKRDSGKADWRALMAAGIIIVVFLIVALFAFLKIRSIRARQHLSQTSKQRERANNPSWLRRKYRQFNPFIRHQKYSSRLQDDAESSLSGRAANDPNGNNNTREMSAVDANGIETDPSGVDRHTSIRSIMTLPAYAPTARENERILAREGERAGIDVVLEFPESDNEEETRRNEEMESLYQIRVARRAEQAEREDRRRRRREARERGDMETLSRLRRESRMQRGGRGVDGQQSSAQLIAEHQAQVQARERRVSSVQYAALGVQRHDGTRLRANSTEDDNRPLLEGAASMADTNTTTNNSAAPTPSPLPGAPGPVGVGRGMMHHRDFSATSIMSNETTASEDAWTSAQQQQTQRNPSHDSSTASGSNTTDFEVIRLSNSRSRSPSGSRLTPAVTLDSARLPRASIDSRATPRLSSDSRLRSSSDAVAGVAPPAPPLYEELVGGSGWEEAPPYTSPVDGRAPVLPGLGLERLPSIQVTEGQVEEETSGQAAKKEEEERDGSGSGSASSSGHGEGRGHGEGQGHGEGSATASASATGTGTAAGEAR
ncbi:hypothetical protein K490DRAFT_55423 [Saccharata proteae CBS 121410]|uniref:Uncharacterized protein n=1 Tax=Saccharata proteae CBS 121410 TaxID=1314787 RepID=A0A6A5YBV3_9PEZI|nr:hypothetical protein K490DRAFT_55423 [Saccharata proteae CBS 121410]